MFDFVKIPWFWETRIIEDKPTLTIIFQTKENGIIYLLIIFIKYLIIFYILIKYLFFVSKKFHLWKYNIYIKF